MNKLFSMMLTALITLWLAGPAAAEVFSPTVFKLDNGLQVVVIEKHRSPVVTQMLWYKVGASDEPTGKTGMAHLLEHLMFKGTQKFPDGEFSAMLARHGGNENAFTALDYTGYHQTVSRDRLEMVMELEADRMRNLVLRSGDINTEREVILEERRQRIGNNPSGELRLQIDQALFPGDHAYGRPVIGWEADIVSITKQDLEAFYQQHYSPANAVLVVAGDVTPGEVKALAEKYYAPIKNGAAPIHAALPFPKKGKPSSVVLNDARVRQPSWNLSILAPSMSSDDKREIAALEVLNEVMGGGTTSRLYRALVVEQGIAVAAGARYASGARGPGRFLFYASPKPGVSLDALQSATAQEVEKFIEQGFVTGELARVKKRMLASAVYVRDELKSGAWALGGALAAGHSVMDVEGWPERIRTVTGEDIKKAARKLWRDPRRVSAKLLPAEPNSGGGG